MEELESAGNRLRAALDEYLSVCSRMDDLVCREGMPRNLSQRCLNHIKTEITSFTSYGPKLRQAETAVSRIHNRSSQLAPIASLPQEILTYTFHLVTKPCNLLDLQPEYSDEESFSSSSEDSDGDLEKYCGESKLNNFPTHLDRLVHVCSYWRQVAIASPSLWTHIDFIPHKTLHKGLLARAEAYALRSLGLPIELHVSNSRPLACGYVSLGEFLSSIRDRIESLDFVVSQDWRRFHDVGPNEVFFKALSQSTALTKIKTSCPLADDGVDEFVHWFEETNECFLHVSILHLHGLFPLWRSTAYHNLVELRLISPQAECWTQIREPSLRNVLASSPGLRIFHFALHITDRQSDDASVIPVPLNDLEVLGISTDHGIDEGGLSRPEHVLRLIAPGSKSLQLSICHDYSEPGYDDTGFPLREHLKFFQRSNIAKFRARSGCPRLDLLLQYAPNLDGLALDGRIFGWKGTEWLGRGNPLPSRLNSLILFECCPSEEEFKLLLQQYPADRLFLYECENDFYGQWVPFGWILEFGIFREISKNKACYAVIQRNCKLGSN